MNEIWNEITCPRKGWEKESKEKSRKRIFKLKNGKRQRKEKKKKENYVQLKNKTNIKKAKQNKTQETNVNVYFEANFSK